MKTLQDIIIRYPGVWVPKSILKSEFYVRVHEESRFISISFFKH